jgi:hypothetical protein
MMTPEIWGSLTTALARLLIFPGLLFAVPAAWFFLWVALALPSCSHSLTSSNCWAKTRLSARA